MRQNRIFVYLQKILCSREPNNFFQKILVIFSLHEVQLKDLTLCEFLFAIRFFVTKLNTLLYFPLAEHECLFRLGLS